MAECADDSVEWSDDILSLRDISNHLCLPCVVRVCEGYYNLDDISTFSLGDLLKIVSCEEVKKVTASYVTWTGWDKSGSKDIAGHWAVDTHDTISIPVVYRGTVRLIPKRGAYHVYEKIVDVLEDFPRYIQIQKSVHFKDHVSSKIITLNEGDILETTGWKKPSHSNKLTSFLKCLHAENTILIPSTLTGKFLLIRDEEEYTIKEVISRFPLPQIVQFVEPLNTEVTSPDVMEAFGNLDSFDGKMLLNSVYSEKVLVGHYKSLETKEEGRFIKRTAFVLPLINTDLCDITVQYPLYMDSSDYELFVAKNFTETKLGPQVMDKALYLEFTKKPQVRFSCLDEGDEGLKPPPRPPRGHTKLVSPVTAMTKPRPRTPIAAPKSNPVPPILKQPQQQVVKPQAREKTQRNEIKKYESISDIDWSKKASEDDFKKEDGVEKSPISFLKKTFIKFKKPSISNKPTDNPDTTDEQGEGSDDSTYDYPDLSNLNLKPTKQFHDFTVEELQEVFKVCNMPNLMKLCIKEAYDGRIFSQFSDDTLKSNPFKLKQNDLVKLQCIKEGWRPTHSNSKPQSSTKL